MPFVLYVVNVKGESDFGRLEFEREKDIEDVIADELEIPYYQSDSDSDSESWFQPAYHCSVSIYSFSTKKDRSNAKWIFNDVHDYIDYDHSKTSDIFYMTQEKYLDKISKKGIWLILEGTEWVKLSSNHAKILEKYYIEFDPFTDQNLYYEFSGISFDFNTMTFVVRPDKTKSWDELWTSKNVKKIKRKC